MQKYGIVVLRAQPFHIGHEYIIRRIIKDGLQPVLMLGSANESGTEKNPYTAQQRAAMIHLVYPDILIGALNDNPCNNTWINRLIGMALSLTNEPLEHSTIYLHEKLEDLQNFTFRGIDYLEESYCKMYEIAGLHTTSLPLSKIQIRAKAIREDLEGNNQFLHPKVYEYIKGLREIF